MSSPGPGRGLENQYRQGPGARGTVRNDRAGLPVFEEKQKPDEQVFYHTNNLLALRWIDKRKVTMLSTLHEPITLSNERTEDATSL
ncbi:unnamed protein product, partial [Rotaria sp. Silwood2]